MDLFFDKGFIKDTNPHKFIVSWSSKYHTRINKILRNIPYRSIVEDLPYARYYISHLYNYFITHGVSRGELKERGYDKLWRGFDKAFTPFQNSDSLKEKGLMSTTYKEPIAQEFAGTNGTILTFDVKRLPEDVPFVIIDESIADHLLEGEVLLLPGKLVVHRKEKSTTTVKYKVNRKFIKMFKDPMMFGGAPPGLEERVPDLELRNKYCMCYRAIEGRAVEVIYVYKFPKTDAEVKEFFKTTLTPLLAEYEGILRFIPEYQDLCVQLQTQGLSKEERSVVMRRWASYDLHFAIYNAKSKKVEHIAYTEYNWLLDELGFDRTREAEIKRVIKKHGRYLK